jgi:hypothetical protein
MGRAYHRSRGASVHFMMAGTDKSLSPRQCHEQTV